MKMTNHRHIVRLIIAIVSLFPHWAYAQGNGSENIVTQKTQISYPQFKEAIKEASNYYSCENYRGNGICFGNLKSSLDLDVFEYYSLDDKYSTDLQKDNFKRTPEYKDKLSELSEIRRSSLNTPLYIELNNVEDFEISDYNLKEGGFYLRTGIKLIPPEFAIYNKYYELQPLPAKTSISAYYHPSINRQKLYDRFFFLPISRDVAPEIEQHKEQIRCIVFFVPQGINKKDNGFFGYDYFASSDAIRLIVINQETSKVYFDKLYTTVRKTTKQHK